MTERTVLTKPRTQDSWGPQTELKDVLLTRPHGGLRSGGWPEIVTCVERKITQNQGLWYKKKEMKTMHQCVGKSQVLNLNKKLKIEPCLGEKCLSLWPTNHDL